MVESLVILLPLMLFVVLNSFKKILKAELFWVSIDSLLVEHETMITAKMLTNSHKNFIFFMIDGFYFFSKLYIKSK